MRKHSRRNALVSLGVLAPIVAVVVYSSFQLSQFECEVCMSYQGHEVCRTVTGQTEVEGLRTGIDNACALIASGVTDTLKCQRTQPTKAVCKPI